jgi:hypothetical protein
MKRYPAGVIPQPIRRLAGESSVNPIRDSDLLHLVSLLSPDIWSY